MWTMRWASWGDWIEANRMSGGMGELASGSESVPCRGRSRLARWRLAFDELTADLVAAAGLGDEI